MRIGIMQPYFFPYIGYWQLINYVDKFVLYDDVNYINRGWINRNRILINGEPAYITIPLKGASQNKLICQIDVMLDEKNKRQLLHKIQSAYGKAPHFEEIYSLIETVIKCETPTIAGLNQFAIKCVCDFLGITTDILVSSELEKDNSLHGQEKILEICKRLDGNEYINAIGGKELYDKKCFMEQGISLGFLQMGEICYEQFGNAFVDNLSIIDVMMFCDVDMVRDMLDCFYIK